MILQYWYDPSRITYVNSSVDREAQSREKILYERKEKGIKAGIYYVDGRNALNYIQALISHLIQR